MENFLPPLLFFFSLPCARGRKIVQKLIREDGDRRAMMSTIKWRLFSPQWGGLIGISEAKAKWTAGEDESASCSSLGCSASRGSNPNQKCADNTGCKMRNDATVHLEFKGDQTRLIIQGFNI